VERQADEIGSGRIGVAGAPKCSPSATGGCAPPYRDIRTVEVKLGYLSGDDMIKLKVGGAALAEPAVQP
jgi:hypothetical protein